ncbi:hypothetical protein [Parvularcula marina]|uniref:Ppx/GppA phosphatase family protein n=1 Tax=Parvularcula marina TaxID=2292771 RepID=UPI0035163CDB
MTDRKSTAADVARGAVIDIGSNSIRLVIYEGPSRCPIQVFNEKTLCGLGERDRDTGRLQEENMADALFTLERFRLLLDAADPDVLHVFATSAVREAPNGQDFLAEVEALGYSPLLVSGEEEAKLAAYGILSGVPDILHMEHGALAGDIGGGSLELSHIHKDIDGWVGERTSLPLGALRLYVDFEEDRAAARKHIESEISKVDWLGQTGSDTLYVVGGAWRSLAKIAQAQAQYPIEILDRYVLTRKDAARLCQVVSKQHAESLSSMPVVQRRRAPTLPYAAMVLEAVLDAAKVDRLEVVSSGVREGVLFAGLPQEVQRLDPLIEIARHLATRFGSHLRPPAEELNQIIQPLFSSAGPTQKRWLRASCELSNFSAGLEPDERASHAAKAIMALPLKGLSHHGRIFLSAALAGRHGASEDELLEWLPFQVLPDEMRRDAQLLGLTLRFLSSLAPAGGPALKEGAFVLGRGSLGFTLPASLLPLWGAGPAKRFERIAAFLELEAVHPS